MNGALIDEPRKWLFLVSYARSGSTLLQGILNTSPNLHLAGENGNFVYGLYTAWAKLKAQKVSVGTDRSRPVTHPFFGIDLMDEDALFPHYRHALATMLMQSCPQNKSPDTIGFKEIRYPYVSDLEEFLSFMSSCFDPSLFIFLTRDLEKVTTSVLFDRLSEPEREQLLFNFLDFERKCEQLVTTLPSAFMVSYEEVIARPDKLPPALAQFGVSLNERDVLNCLKVQHSYTTTERNGC